MLRLIRGAELFTIRVASADREVDQGVVRYAGQFEVATGNGRAVEVVRHRSRGAAFRSLHAQVAEHKASGFLTTIDDLAVEPAVASCSFASFTELEAAIDDAPSDEDAWMVLADAWAHAGDPRGDCVLLARALLDVRDPSKFLANKRAAAAANRVRVGSVLAPLGADDYRIGLTFRRGLVDRIELANEEAAPGRPLRELLAEVLAHPFARFASTIAIPSLVTADVFDAIAAQTHPTIDLIEMYYQRDEAAAEGAFAASRLTGFSRAMRVTGATTPVTR